MKLQATSLGIGAGVTVVAIIAAFFAFNIMSEEKQLAFVQIESPTQETILEQTESLKQEPQKIHASVLLENGSPYLGDPAAPITLVEFGDYQCFFCNKFFHTTEPDIISNYVETGKVKIIFKDFTIIGSDSVTAAHAAHCADDQGKFWEYHDILYNNWTGENNGWASSVNLHRFAQNVGLDINEFSECMKSKIHMPLIAASVEDAKTLGLGGTPGFFVIGVDNQIIKIPGAQPYSVFERIFDSELEK